MVELVNIPQGVYEHYKSTPENPKRYFVVLVSDHTETGEALVSYIPMYTDLSQTGRRAQTRPASMFCERIEYKGKLVPRFKWLGVDGRLYEAEE